jgi:threonine aldolase
MRQAGILASAGIVALTDYREQLAIDHENAGSLAEGLARIDELQVTWSSTNMVFVWVVGGREAELVDWLRERSILVAGRNALRLVTHRDVSKQDIERVVREAKNFFRKAGAALNPG